MEPVVTTKIYDYETKELTNTESDVISFGAIPPSSNSEIIIINCVISNVISAGELGIGIANVNLPPNEFNDSVYYSVFDSLDEVTDPILSFQGVSGYNGLNYVVDVGFQSKLISKYVALRVKTKDNPLACGCIVFKWFFGFDKKEI